MQVQQLEEELGREQEEKARAVRELEELRRDGESAAREKARLLEKEAHKSKESERKMLESLIYQTKQLEQTKISLEEAKLEIASLQQANKRSVKDLVFGGEDEEIRVLRSELRAAAQDEERSRKAVDDLSVALSDVTMEARQVKLWLSETQAELEAAHDLCRLEAEECAAAWGDKERVLLDCVRASDDEVNRARQENTKLVESQRVIRDENARLRDILKEAVAEASAVKDALELARAETARLEGTLAEKDAALQSLRQEYECVKVSEAAAQGSLKELNSLLVATACSTPASAKTAPAPDYGYDHQLLLNSAAVSKTGTPKAAAHRWLSEKSRTPRSRRFSIGCGLEKFKGDFSQSARMGNLDPKERVLAPLGSIAHLKSAADAAMDGFDDDDEFDHADESHYSDSSKKKRPIFRKFGDLFRRKSFDKANLAPVHS
jgi:hypothetical protein